MNNTLTKESLLFSFPTALRENESIAAMGDVTSEALAARMPEIERLAIYTRIRELPEELLDILAWDFKVDWWDQDADVEQKRRTLEDNWNVHRRLGTKWAVVTELNNVYPGATVQEWFEYGGRPYCFRVQVPITTTPQARSGGILEVTKETWPTDEQHQRALSRIWYYKNLRSHLDGVDYVAETPTPPLGKGVGMISGLGFAVTETVLPCVEPRAERYRLQSRFSIGAGFHTLAEEPRMPNYEPAFDYKSPLGFGTDFRTMSKDHLPRLEKEVEYKSPLSVTSLFQTTSKDSLPPVEPGYKFRGGFKAADDFLSVIREEMPKIEPELSVVPSVPSTPLVPPTETAHFDGKLAIASNFQDEITEELPRLEAEHEFNSGMAVASGMQNAVESDLPKLEPVQEFSGAAGIASDVLSGNETELPDISFDFEKEQSFEGRVNLIAGMGEVSKSEVPKLEPERSFEGPVLMAAVTKRAAASAAAPEESRQEPGQKTEETLERVLKSKSTIVSGLQEVSDTIIPKLEPEQRFEGKTGIASGTQSITETQT